MIWSSILCERLKFSQHIIWKVVFDVVRHIDKEKENNSSHKKWR